LVKFSLVGGSGVLVNLLVAFACKKIAPLIWAGAHEGNVWWDIPFTDYNVRWYHIFSMLAFVVANLSNYQLNRVWSFKSDKHAGWFAELAPFFTVGLVAQLIGMLVETQLMHPESIIGLSDAVFDGSTGFRTKWYWAHLAMICVTIPVSFLLNKFWTFRAIRRGARGDESDVASDSGSKAPVESATSSQGED
jgi:putative flippase GtrA